MGKRENIVRKMHFPTHKKTNLSDLSELPRLVENKVLGKVQLRNEK